MTSFSYEFREVLLHGTGINLWLGGRHILRDVEVEIRNIHRPEMTQGQVVGLLGPSGMGKTQLFRILAGLNPPDTGTVTIAENRAVVPGMVGVVAQNYPLFAHRTVIGNLTVAGKQSGMADPSVQAMELLKKFSLEQHAEKYPSQLSGGQRQRIAVAQQFMCSEGLLLMDEPFSGLDPIAVSKMTNFICTVAASDELKTMVVVTHDIAAAVEVCDTLWILGRDRDANGNPVDGARIQKTINLIDRGLAWQHDITRTPAFHATVDEVRAEFDRL